MYELAHIHKYDSNLFWDGRNTDLNYHWFVIYAFSYDEVRNPDDYYHQIGNYFRGTPLSNNIQIVDLYEKDERITESDEELIKIKVQGLGEGQYAWHVYDALSPVNKISSRNKNVPPSLKKVYPFKIKNDY